MNVTKTRVETALSHARQGWPVHPLHTPDSGGKCSCGQQDCTSPGKHPRTGNGLKDATTDEATIREWWQQWPDANIGIVTGKESGLVVLDIDPRHGGDKALRQLEEKWGSLPETVEAITGEGRHLFFKHPGRPVKNRTHIAPGLDVRGDGGYVVASGSIHANGKVYRWHPSKGPDQAPLADIPEPWKDLFECPLQKVDLAVASSGKVIIGESKIIPEGQRHTTLVSLAGTMRRRGMLEQEIKAGLCEVNRRRCSPPLPEEEIEQIARSIARYEPESTTVDIHLTDDIGNANRLVSHHGQDLRYCYPWGKWLVWDGKHWMEDITGEIYRRAKDTVNRIYLEAAIAGNEKDAKEIARHAMRSGHATRLRAMIELAQPEVPVVPEELDSNPWLLNVQNGTLDLRTGELREHRREDLITKLAPVRYDPAAKCPWWESFLGRIMDGNEALTRFLQRTVGYALTGSIREQVAFMMYGTGANGKTTLLDVILALMGNYAQQSDFTTFLKRHSDGPRNDLARLVGARFVSATEVESGRRLDEVVVKQVTGGDKIAARFLHQEFFEFVPQFKLFLASNHKPVIYGTDHAIWRRIKLIPFTLTIPEDERDKDLPAKLKQELPGILTWAVRGCLAWQKDGLGIPEEVKTATGEYREEMDVLAEFLDEYCILDPDSEVATKDLYQAYGTWCEGNGEKPLRKNTFGMRLAERGLEKTRIGSRSSRGWKGLRLNPESMACRKDYTDTPDIPDIGMG